MKKYIITLIVISLFSQITMAKNSYYKVSFSIGNFFILHANKKEWSMGQNGAILKKGYLVKTDINTEILLTMGNEKIKIKENTVVRIDDLLNSKKKKEILDISSLRSKLIKIFLKENQDKVTIVSAIRADRLPGEDQLSLTDDINEKNSSKQTDHLKKAKKQFSMGDYSSTIITIKNKLNKIPAEQQNEAIYLLGISYFNNGNFEECIINMDSFNNKVKQDDHRLPSIKLYIAISYNYLGNDKKSIQVLDNLIKKYPRSDLLPRAYYLLATIYRMKNQNKQALKYYEHIENKYPHSDVYDDSKNEINKIKLLRK